MPELKKGNRSTLSVKARATYVKHKQEAFKGMSNSNRDVYNTNRWRKLRAIVLKSSPICIICEKKNRYTSANVVDHIKPINKGGYAWEMSNLQALCAPCHNSKSAKDK